MIDLYGIPNCDTVKKARKWLDAEAVEYRFHDFKKEGVTLAQLEDWVNQAGMEVVLNKRGTTWRKLPEDLKADLLETQALQPMMENPSMIKRPVLVLQDGGVHIGFEPGRYAELLGH